MSTRFRSTWICRCVTNHTHTHPHITHVPTRFLYTTYVSTRWFCTWFRPCVYIHIQPSENISSARIVYVHSMSVHMGESIGFHTPHTPTNHGNQVNIKRVGHTWCRRGVAAHTPHTPMHHRNHEERARINHNYVSTRILSSWFCLFVPKTHTHTYRTPHPPRVQTQARAEIQRFRASAVLDVARNSFISGSAVLGSARNEPIPGKRRFGRCPE